VNGAGSGRTEAAPTKVDDFRQMAIAASRLLGAHGALLPAAVRGTWGGYRRAGLAVTEPAPRALGGVVTTGETALAAVILSRYPAARLRRLPGAAFLLGVAPLGIFALGNPILAVGALYLARRPWPRAVSSRRRST
jgi:hypothetical protein